MNELTLSNTCLEISPLVKISQGPLHLEIFQIPCDFEARSNPISRPVHLLFIGWGHRLSAPVGFPLVFFSWFFCLAQRPCILPGKLFCVISCWSGCAGYCPQGQERMRKLLYRNRDRPLRLASDCVQLGREPVDQMNSELSSSSEHQVKALPLQKGKKKYMYL